MNKVATIINVTLMITTLSACSEKTQTVEWYLEHPDKLEKEFEKCKDKALKELVRDKHCITIREAKEKAFDEHQMNAPVPTFK